jgi:hypothetical protein
MAMSAHLSQRQIEEYRRRALPAAELLALDDHIAECPDCRLRLAAGEPLSGALQVWDDLSREDRAAVGIDLGALVDESRDGGRRPARGAPRPLAVALWAAGLLLVTGLLAWLATLPLRREVESLRTEVRTMRNGRPAPAPVIGLEALPAGLRETVAAALRDGRLERPVEIAELRGTGAVLRGVTASARFAPLSPLATDVLDGRPTFRWSALPGAESYRVRVFDPDFNPVADSGSLPGTGTEWIPVQPLRAGDVYAWQIKARGRGKEVTAPGPTSPQALFRVLEEKQAVAVRSEALTAGSSHLARGVIYARAGLADDAERELGAAVREEPDSEGARKLLESVQAWRTEY